MHRRDFIRKSAVAGITGPAVIQGLYMNELFGNPGTVAKGIDIPSPYLDKLLVKPVLTTMYHTGVWEGPCRFNVTTVEEEKKWALSEFENFRGFIGNHPADRAVVEFMEPGQVLFVEDFRISEAEFAKIDDAMRADVLYVNPVGCSVSNYDVARRYRKPMVLSAGLNCRTVDVSAYCRSHGLECYVPDSPEETDQVFTLLKARKNFTKTRVLYPTNWKWPSVCSIAGIDEPEKLKERFGIEVVTISYSELSDEMERVRADRNLQKDAASMADTVYTHADRSFIDKKYVANSMEFYQCVVNLMKRHDCNAFTIECFEFCTSRLPQKWNITPCLVHTTLKDLGIPSACEGDLGGLLAMHMLMSLSNKSPHFGNMFYQTGGKGVLTVNHSVPGIKMNGFDKPGLPYQLAHFVASGWGTKAVVDFMNNEEKDVTVARMNPRGNGLLVLKGRLVGSKGWSEDQLGCYVEAHIVGKETGTAEEFVRKQADYGNHLPWVYGDYAALLEKLGKMIGIEVEVIS